MQGDAAKRTKRHSMEWRFAFPVLVTGLPANNGRWYIPPYRSQALRPDFPSIEGRLLRMLLPDAASLWACRNFQQPVHHWHPTVSNHRAVSSFLIINRLRREKRRLGLDSRTSRGGVLRKNVERQFTVHSSQSLARREGDPQTYCAGIGRII